jgi:hypothetical protein
MPLMTVQPILATLVCGWLIEPIARHLGQRSVQASLEEFQRAMRARRAVG